MEKLSFQQFELRQPSFPEERPTDKHYYDLCCHLIEVCRRSGLVDDYHPAVVNRAMLALVGYVQDVVSDAGLWHAFTDWCRKYYGRPVPFYDCGRDDYIDYELNLADVRFMVWYGLSMYSDLKRVESPKSENLMMLGKILYDELERSYDELPMPDGYVFGRELELHDEDDRETILELGHWLFMNSWLLTPAYALTLTAILQEVNEQQLDEGAIRKRMEQSMNEDPTGPLALYLGEWVELMIEGKIREHKAGQGGEVAPVTEHPYYAKMMDKYKDNIAYFADYKALQEFFIGVLGWDADEQHLPQLMNGRDFVVMADRGKGLLLAMGVARCIADPHNELYDKDYAKINSIRLLTERGLCPPDLRTRIIADGWLPDAQFPGSDDTELVKDNADFIARCYLGLYYRGD